MNLDRLLRDLEQRLAHLPEELRREVRDALREESARARRRLDPSDTLEAERERRIAAETLREVLEALGRPSRLQATVDEVLRQLTRVVECDSCSLGLLHDNRCRIVSARGFPDPGRVLAWSFEAPVVDEIRQRHWTVSLDDAQQDERFLKLPGTPPIRSWAGLPLLVEGEVIGVLHLDRLRLDPFTDDELHLARAVAFSAAAAVRKAQLHEQVRGYARLLELVVAVDRVVLDRRPLAQAQRVALDGALALGPYQAGALLLADTTGAHVAAAAGGWQACQGRALGPEKLERRGRRLASEEASRWAADLDITPSTNELLLVPLQAGEHFLGMLALVDSDGDSPQDRLIEAYAARAAAALLHAQYER